MKLMLPAFLKKLFNNKSDKRHCGIAIYKEIVRVVVLGQNENGFFLEQYNDVPYQSEDHLPAVLATIVKDYELSDFVTSIVIPNYRSQSTQIDLTELPQQDAQEALPWKLKDLINIPPQDMICDFIDMPLQPFGQTPKVQVMATSRSYLERVIAPFHEAGAEISQILTEQFSVAKLQTNIDTAQLVFLQHAKSEATILILKNQQICFARKVRGSDSLVTMSPDQIKLGGTDNVAVEIQRSIDYYESQLKQPPIKNVFIAIDGDNLDHVVAALDLSLPVKSKRFVFDEMAGDADLSLQYIPAIGAAKSTFSESVEPEAVK